MDNVPSASAPQAELKAELSARALALGFHRIGVARADPLTVEGERLRAWLAAGRNGNMAWMEETADVRTNVRDEGMLPSAQSVIVLATSYARAAAAEGPAPLRVARYAQGRDYHTVLDKRLRKLAKFLRERGHRARQGVDAMPIFERAWAQRAGLGFIGKNACLIIPGLGSHVFLSAIITDAELAPDEPMRERCGTCNACLEACPTRAFAGPRQLDARRCISYLTIEERGPIPSELRAHMGSWLYGCDACQDVCPFNRTAPRPASETEAFAASERWADYDAELLLTLDDEAWELYAYASPMQRAGRISLARNAAIGLGNTRDKRHLPVLSHAAEHHDDERVREAAAWARDRLSET